MYFGIFTYYAVSANNWELFNDFYMHSFSRGPLRYAVPSKCPSLPRGLKTESYPYSRKNDPSMWEYVLK